ncbi:MAG: YHS domain-containing protein [Proteobacteria bacterium]|nr:YHS domain-containing protein [Pseudomonadota bacterium]MBU1711149.1 YHS domain-containing protein [Pseudomonadota bacterium]
MMTLGNILWLLIIGLFFAFMMKKGGGCCGGGGHEKHDEHAHTESGDGKKIDPVCKMEVDPGKAAHETDYRGEKIFFCSTQCRDKFENAPETFLKSHDTESHGSCH